MPEQPEPVIVLTVEALRLDANGRNDLPLQKFLTKRGLVRLDKLRVGRKVGGGKHIGNQVVAVTPQANARVQQFLQ